MTTKQTEAPQTLASAMAQAFSAIEAATKASPGQVGQQKYKYADLTAVIEAIKPALVANGLFFTQQPRVNERGVEIETVLHHKGGEVYSLGCLFVPADRNNAQGFGSALTYARRYALVTAFGVPVEDDDGAAASKTVTPAIISDADCVLLMQLIEATQTDVRKFCGAFGVTAVKSLPADAFSKAKAMLEKKLADAEKEQDDA